MPTAISCGTPAWVDGVDMSAQSPFRQYDVGTRVHNVGNAAANQVPGGVFPGLADMKVTPGSGMNLAVNAGYCCVPNSSSGLQGGYLFGLMNAGTLTVAAASPSTPRIDLVVARVYDLGTSASYCSIELVTGTPATPAAAPAKPANSIILAQISVPAAVTTITTAMITDLRAWVVAPGGILPIANTAAAPAAPAYQLFYNIATGLLCTGSGTAGSVAPLSALKWVPQITVHSAPVTAPSGGALTQISSCSVVCDGFTDLEIHTKWAYLLGNAAYIQLLTYIDGVQCDVITVTAAYYLGGSHRAFTSPAQGNTPAAGTHLITWKFLAGGSGMSAADGVFAAAGAPCILRVAPAVV
jgi:hypothetical protein